jgi:hypothetical protein
MEAETFSETPKICSVLTIDQPKTVHYIRFDQIVLSAVVTV